MCISVVPVVPEETRAVTGTVIERRAMVAAPSSAQSTRSTATARPIVCGSRDESSGSRSGFPLKKRCCAFGETPHWLWIFALTSSIASPGRTPTNTLPWPCTCSLVSTKGGISNNSDEAARARNGCVVRIGETLAWGLWGVTDLKPAPEMALNKLTDGGWGSITYAFSFRALRRPPPAQEPART